MHNHSLATKAGYPQLRQWFTRMNDLASVQKGLKSLGVSTPQNLTFEKFVPRPPATKEEKRKQMEKARADRKKVGYDAAWRVGEKGYMRVWGICVNVWMCGWLRVEIQPYCGHTKRSPLAIIYTDARVDVDVLMC